MKNIFLVGMPSSGKTTLGKRLSRELGYRFVDTDRLIVREEGKTINEIFHEQGEPYFRQAESRVLRTIRPEAGLVVATGGGMPCFHNNMEYIRQTGISVFLDVAPEVLLERMQRHQEDDRPLFRQNDPPLLEGLHKKDADRRPVYSQADIHLQGTTTVEELLQQLSTYL